MAAKNGGKRFLEKVTKNFNKIALSRIVSEINAFLHLMQKFKMATKNGGKMIIGKSHQLTLLIPSLGVKNFDQIDVSHTISQINAFLRFTQKFKMAAQWQENDFWENSSVDSGDTLALKIFTKSLYLAPFSRYLHFFIFR